MISICPRCLRYVCWPRDTKTTKTSEVDDDKRQQKRKKKVSLSLTLGHLSPGRLASNVKTSLPSENSGPPLVTKNCKIQNPQKCLSHVEYHWINSWALAFLNIHLNNLEPRVSPALCQRLVARRNSGIMEFL